MFTPGPWVVDQDEHRYSASHHVRSYIRTTKDCCPPLNLNYAVAEISALTFSEQEQKGNARLIAAAPEMLEMLEKIRSGMNCICRLSPLAGMPVPCETCQIESLIKKAKDVK